MVAVEVLKDENLRTHDYKRETQDRAGFGKSPMSRTPRENGAPSVVALPTNSRFLDRCAARNDIAY
jgi:hypothetical protein